MGNQEVKVTIQGEDKTQAAIQSTSSGLNYLGGTITKLSIQWAAFSTAWGSAMQVIGKGMQYIDLGAQALKAKEAFAAMTDAVGANAGELAAAMKKAAGGFVADSHLMQKAVFALAQDIDPQKIPQLFEAARVASRKTGADVETSIDGMVQAIATNMPRSLRQMGMITKEQMGLLNQAMAAGIDDVTLLGLVLANVAVDTAKFGDSANNAAKDIARFKVECAELKETIGGWLIVGLQKLMGELQGVAGFALTGAMGIFKLIQAGYAFMAWSREKSGMSLHEVPGLREQERFWKEQADAAEEASIDLYKRSVDNMYGTPGSPDQRSKAQKDKDIAEAEAERDALEKNLERRLAAAKGAEKVAKLQAEWDALQRSLDADLAGSGLNEFEKKLIAIEKKAEELRSKEAVQKAPGGVAKVGLWAETMGDEAAIEQGKKDFKDWLDIQHAREKLTKELTNHRKALREGEIQARLAGLDLAEKEGTAYRDTIAERIRLLTELKNLQEKDLAGMDKQKDPAAWYAQADAINATRIKLVELGAAQRPVFEALRRYADEATDVWKNVAGAVTRAFKGMEDALTEFVMTGKLSFTDFANSVIRDLVRIMIQQQVTGPLAAAAGGFLRNLFTGGGNAGVGATATESGGAAFEAFAVAGSHRGGMGNEPSFYRIMANPDLLPRYHKGLGPGERLSVTTDDEMTLTPGQQKRFFELAQAATGKAAPSGGDENHIHVHLTVNALDSRSVSQALAQHQGQVVGMVQQAFNKIGKRGPLGS